ncbi:MULTISPECIES: hypothetical protein [Bordetella]|nr:MULTISPECIES: hypothetical protein [Bordetella]
MFHRFKARRSGGLGGRAAGQSDAQAATAPARAEPARPRLRYGGRGWAGYIDQEG